MVFLFENISEHYLRIVLETGMVRVFLSQNNKNVFHGFLLEFWANVPEIFEKDFLLTI